MSARQPVVILGMRFRSRNRAISVAFILLAFVASLGIVVSRLREKKPGPTRLTSVQSITGDEFKNDFQDVQSRLAGIGQANQGTREGGADDDLFRFPGTAVPTATPAVPSATALPTAAPPVTFLPTPHPSASGLPGLTPLPTPAVLSAPEAAIQKVRAAEVEGNRGLLERVAVDTVEPVDARVLAISAVARRGDDEAFELLRRIVINEAERFPFRETAIYAMVEFFSVRCCDFLVERIRDPKVSRDEDEDMHDLVLLAFYADREASEPPCRIFVRAMPVVEKLMREGNHLARQVYSFGMVMDKIPQDEASRLREIDDLVIRSNLVSWLRRKALSTEGKVGLDELRRFATEGKRKELRTLASVALARVNERLVPRP